LYNSRHSDSVDFAKTRESGGVGSLREPNRPLSDLAVQAHVVCLLSTFWFILYSIYLWILFF
jgi:hypothetical protein